MNFIRQGEGSLRSRTPEGVRVRCPESFMGKDVLPLQTKNNVSRVYCVQSLIAGIFLMILQVDTVIVPILHMKH